MLNNSNHPYDFYDFYIFFPGGYENRVSNVNKDIVDIFVIRKNNLKKVYLGTLYTIDIINDIFRSGDLFVTEKNMIIISDLNRSTIYQSIAQIIDDDYLENILSYEKYSDIFENNELRDDLL